ncbi:MAG TPA: hypothetical protein VGT08_18510 [Terracidiphilus sp.]|nr:hypothetical protein [Terracidiphilus sp.]
MKLTKNEWLHGVGRQMRQNPVVVVLMVMGLLGTALEQAASAQALSTTTVQGTVYLANGQAGSGTLRVSWSAFTTANGQAVVADSTTVTIGPDGFVSVNLAPNLGATPAGLYYTAVFYLSDGTTSTQYWVVPSAAQASLAQVQSQVMPAAQAVQAVNKAYVDQSIAALSQSQLTASGGTLNGPLYLNADPTQAMQAADKHYVDTAVSQSVPISGGATTGPLTALKLGAAYQVDQFQGADFGAKLQACLSAVSAAYGGTCDARNFSGTLAMGSNLTISTGNTTVELPCATIATANQMIVTAGTRNVALRGCALRGGTAASGSQGGTVFAYSGSGAMVQVGDPTYATDTQGFHLDDVVINTTAATSATAQGLVAYRTQEMDLESLYFLGNTNQTGMTLDGTGNYTGGTFYDNALNGFQTAVNAIGHQVSNSATTDWMNASAFVRLHIDCPTSGGNPIAGTYGINLQQGDGNTFTGGDVEGCSTALHLGANAQNNTIVGLRNENSSNQVVADAGSSYNNWMTGGTMFTGKLTDNGTRNSFLDTFHRSFNGMNGDWYGSQQDATVTNHYRIGIGTGNERGLLNRYQTDYGYRWTTGLSDATAGEQFYQILDELNNVYRLSIGQYNNGQPSANSQTVINAAGTGAVVLNGSNNAGTGGVVIGSGGPGAAAVATINNAGNAQFNGALQVGGTSTFAGSTTVRNQADAEIDQLLWAGATTSQKESLTYKDWNGNSQWYAEKDASNNWALNSATGGLDSFKAYQSTNSGDTYVNASNASGGVRVNYETGAGTAFKIYGGSGSSLYASFTGTNSIQFPGLAAGSGHDCLQIDNSGYISNTGSACGTGSGSGTVSTANSGQIAYYTGNGTTISGMDAVPLSAGGTGATTAAGALASLGGISTIATSQQTMAGPLNVPTAYAAATGAYQVSATRGVAGYVTPELYGAYGDGIHDDTAAIQTCWDASRNSSLNCRMSPLPSGTACGTYSNYGCYLVNGQLTIGQDTHVSGNSIIGTWIKSEYNGPAIVMAAGPVNGVVMEDFNLHLDPALPNSAGMYFIASATGSPASGGLWDSRFRNINISTPAKECMRLDGGGIQPGYAFNMPNQADEFLHVMCNAPYGQSHPAPLLEISGQTGQLLFQGGYWNADPTSTGTGTGITYTYYPNALVLIQPINGNSANLAPGNITFSDVSVQYGQTGFNIQYAQNINIVDGSHFEDLGTLITSSYSTFSVRDAYMGNVGTSTGGVFNLGGGTRASIEDSTINTDSSHPVSVLATCGYGPVLRFRNNVLPNQTLSTSSCVTENLGISSSTLAYFATEVLVNGDGGTTPIATLSGPTDPGSTVTLVAWGNSFELTSGGNISFGQFATPLSIPSGSSVTLRLYDLGRTYVVESVNGALPSGVPASLSNLTVSTPTTGAYILPASVYAGSMLGSQMVMLEVGKGHSTGNAAQMGFVYQGDNSPTNAMTFSFVGTTPFMTVYNSGTVSFANALTLPNNSTATTQAAGDNSTKVATTAYVATPGAISPTAVTASGIITGANDTTRTTTATMTNSWTTTGLVLPTVPVSTTKNGRCVVLWQMSSTSYTATFGIGMSNTPIGLWGGSGVTYAAAGTSNWLAFSQTSTATTAVSTAATAGATGTTYRAEIDFTLQTGAINPVAITLYGETSNTGGTLTIEPGSTCYWLP